MIALILFFWPCFAIVNNVVIWSIEYDYEKAFLDADDYEAPVVAAIITLIVIFTPIVTPALVLYGLYKLFRFLGLGFVGLYRLKFPKQRITLPRAHARKVPENG